MGLQAPSRWLWVSRPDDREQARERTGFDLESLIVYRCVMGSRAYGLDDDASDT